MNVDRIPSRRGRARGDAGFTAIELAVSSVIVLFVFGAFSSAVVDAVDTSVRTVGGATLQEEARRVLDRLRRDITMTGRIAAAADPTGVAMPAVFSNNAAPLELAAFAHDDGKLELLAANFAPAPEPPEPLNPPPFVAPGNEWEAFGFREFIFRLPEDVTGDGVIVSPGGIIEWSPSMCGYLIVPRPNDPDGLCDLVRRVVDAGGNATDEVVCRQVESATFDIVETKEILPQNAVEVHLHLLRRNTRNGVERLHIACTFVMRN